MLGRAGRKWVYINCCSLLSLFTIDLGDIGRYDNEQTDEMCLYKSFLADACVERNGNMQGS